MSAPSKWERFERAWDDNRVWFWLFYGIAGPIAAYRSGSPTGWAWALFGLIGVLYYYPRHTLSQRSKPYLVRFPLFGGDGIRRAPWPFGRFKTNLFLHVIQQSDGPSLHNHPYEWCKSLILFGSYVQISREGADGQDSINWYRPGNVNRITAATFHTVQLRSRFAITLFWTGSKHGRGWGFLTKRGFVLASGKGGNLRDLSYL